MRIALVTIPRSGSSFYANYLAKKYSIKNAGELFSYGALTKKLGYEFPTSFKDSIKIWTEGNCVAKIFTRDFMHFPDSNETLDYYENLVYGTADKIYYLFRKDTLGQLKSLITADFQSYYGPYKTFKEYNVTIPQNVVFQMLDKIILDKERLEEVYKKYPGERVYLEDFASQEKRYKYRSRFFDENGKEYPKNLNIVL
jgi:hypothetical protein|tara:strand:- start:562 stop:1155 length:594 start_codon:yes stop_codon:yes gene_type:complete